MLYIAVFLALITILYLSWSKFALDSKFSIKNMIFFLNLVGLCLGIGLIFIIEDFFISMFDSVEFFIVGLIITLIIANFYFSMLKPKLTYISAIITVGVFLIILNRDTVFSSSYRDICSELRIDSNCIEKQDSFICKNSTKFNSKIYSKKLCINNSGSNDIYSFKNIPHHLIGKVSVIYGPLLYVKNLARSNCSSKDCGFKYDTKIVSIDGKCSFCRKNKKNPPPLRMEYIPADSKFKVVEAIEYKPKWSLEQPKVILILEDENGQRSELSENDYYKLSGISYDIKTEIETKIMRNKVLFDENKKISEILCMDEEVMNSSRQFRRNAKDAYVQSPHIEIRLLKYSEDFRLKDSFQITELYLKYTEVIREGNTPKIKNIRSCAKVVFNDFSSYLFLRYVGDEWNLDHSVIEDVHISEACLPKESKELTSSICERLVKNSAFKFKSLNELERAFGSIYEYKRM